ncbi:MAG: class I SAM-dependent methyltransferase [Verrucomicrobiota bacterium]|nr:class I SAM-dependent methyltransferase [Verrucomicrobiota bacterium]
MTYQLIDSGEGLKLERFGEYTLIRPCPQALWQKLHPAQWKEADATFSREGGWKESRKLPREWRAEIGGITLKIAPTEFGHLGAFPEHASLWQELCSQAKGTSILNLFAYSGGATLALAKAGARLCHLDASKGMVDWARENAALNQLEKAPIRWIVDDALKFLKREVRRDVRYDGILLDPPTFGRGSKGEVFKIERDLILLLDLCRSVLSKQPRFVFLSCHTPGVTPLALQHLTNQMFKGARVETGEMMLASPGALSIPSGTFAKVLYA